MTRRRMDPTLVSLLALTPIALVMLPAALRAARRGPDWVVALAVAAPWFEYLVFALAWGVFLAGVVQLLFQLPSLYRLDLVPRPRWEL